MIRATGPDQPQIVIEEVTDPNELIRSNARRQKFLRNLARYQDHALHIGEHCRGKHICIGGGELFVADTVQEVLALVRAAHPEDDGLFFKYVYKERAPRIYTNRRQLACVR